MPAPHIVMAAPDHPRIKSGGGGVPLLSGLGWVDRAHGLDSSGFRKIESNRGSQRSPSHKPRRYPPTSCPLPTSSWPPPDHPRIKSGGGGVPLLSGLGWVDRVHGLDSSGFRKIESNRGSQKSPSHKPRRYPPPSCPLPTSSWPGLSRPSTSRRRLVRSGLTPRCRKTWVPGRPPDLIRGRARRWGRSETGRKSKPDSNGLVPAIHVPPPAHPLRAHTAMSQDVDARKTPGLDPGAGMTRRGAGRRASIRASIPPGSSKPG